MKPGWISNNVSCSKLLGHNKIMQPTTEEITDSIKHIRYANLLGYIHHI